MYKNNNKIFIENINENNNYIINNNSTKNILRKHIVILFISK